MKIFYEKFRINDRIEIVIREKLSILISIFLKIKLIY